MKKLLVIGAVISAAAGAGLFTVDANAHSGGWGATRDLAQQDLMTTPLSPDYFGVVIDRPACSMQRRLWIADLDSQQSVVFQPPVLRARRPVRARLDVEYHATSQQHWAVLEPGVHRKPHDRPVIPGRAWADAIVG